MNTQEYVQKLKDQIAAIEAAQSSCIEFSVGSGDFTICKGLQIDFEYSHKEFRYSTDRCGNAYSRTVGILCSKVGIDEDGNEIYVLPSGTMFVAEYEHGSPECFDEWYFRPVTA